MTIKKDKEYYLQFTKDLKNTGVYLRKTMSRSIYLHVNGYTLWLNKEEVYEDHSKGLLNSREFKYIGTLDELLKAVHNRAK